MNEPFTNKTTVVETYAEAIQEAQADYWVNPVAVSDPEQDSWFSDKFHVAETSDSGKVHYKETPQMITAQMMTELGTRHGNERKIQLAADKSPNADQDWASIDFAIMIQMQPMSDEAIIREHKALQTAYLDAYRKAFA